MWSHRDCGGRLRRRCVPGRSPCRAPVLPSVAPPTATRRGGHHYQRSTAAVAYPRLRRVKREIASDPDAPTAANSCHVTGRVVPTRSVPGGTTAALSIRPPGPFGGHRCESRSASGGARPTARRAPTRRAAAARSRPPRDRSRRPRERPRPAPPPARRRARGRGAPGARPRLSPRPSDRGPGSRW